MVDGGAAEVKTLLDPASDGFRLNLPRLCPLADVKWINAIAVRQSQFR